MTDRMDVMKQLDGTRSTHSCPECSAPTYCAMENGKSGWACWCMGVDGVTTAEDRKHDKCVCRKCLSVDEARLD